MSTRTEIAMAATRWEMSGPRPARGHTVNVQRPEVFDKVKVGDRVEITYTEALAVDVKPASKR